MDDKLSIKSSDSVTTSGEYEIVPEELDAMQSTQVGTTSPTLKIANNGDFNDLEKDLTEVIHELDEDPIPVDNVDGIKTHIEAVNEIETGKCHVIYIWMIFLSFFPRTETINTLNAATATISFKLSRQRQISNAIKSFQFCSMSPRIEFK